MARRRPIKKQVRRGAARGTGRRKPAPPSRPSLEQHHLDLIGLGLVAFAAFLAFVLYLGEAGGQAGQAAADGLRVVFGGAALLAPPALLAAGAILVLRPLLPTVRPFRTGAICLFLGLTLGLAAGSMGLGPGAESHEPLLDASYVSDRGGVLGELQYVALKALFSTLGRTSRLPVPDDRGPAAGHRRLAGRAGRRHPGAGDEHERARPALHLGGHPRAGARSRGGAGPAPRSPARAARRGARGPRHARGGARPGRGRALPRPVRRAQPSPSPSRSLRSRRRSRRDRSRTSPASRPSRTSPRPSRSRRWATGEPA